MSKKALSILCATLLGIFTITVVTYCYTDSFLRDEAFAQRQLLRESLSRHVEDTFEQAYTAVYLASSFPSVIAAADPVTSQAHRDLARRQLSKLFRQIHSTDSAFALPFTLLDAQGRTIASSLANAPHGGNQFFHDARQGRLAIQGPNITKETNEATLILAEPVLHDKEVVGVLAGHLDLQQLSIIAMHALDNAGTAHAFALDATGRVVLHSSQPELVGISLAEDAWAKEMLRLKDGETSYEWNGEVHIASFTLLPKSGWLIAVSFPERETMATRRVIRNWGLGSTALTIMLFLFAAWRLLKDDITHLRKAGVLALVGLGNAVRSEEFTQKQIPLGWGAFAHHALSVALEKLQQKQEHIEALDGLHTERFHAVLRTVTDGVLELDKNAEVRFANPAAIAILGKEEKETLGQHIRSILSAPQGGVDTDALLSVHKACLRKQTLEPTSVLLCSHDGALLPVELSVMPISEEESSDGVLLIIRDISFAENKRAILTTLTHAAGGVYFLWDEQLRLVDCAEECTTFFRTDSLKEILTTPEHFMPEFQANGRSSAEELRRHQFKALQMGHESYEWLYQDKFGKTIPCEVVLRRLTFRGRPGLLGLIRDIRLLRAAEFKLADEHAKLEQVLDALPIAVGIVGNGTIFYANHALEELLNHHGTDPGLAPFSPMLFPGADSEPPYRKVWNKSIQLIADDDTVHDYMLSCFPTEHEETTALLGWVVDITHLKSEQQYLLRDKERALAAVKEKEQFLTLLDRELREPINGVLFALQRAMQNTTGAGGQAIHTAYAAGKQLLDTLGYLLNMSGVDTLSLHPELVRFETEKLFRDSLDAFEEHAAAQDITFGLDFDPTLPKELVGDPALLHRILVRLVANAIKYTPSGGFVSAAITRLPATQLNKAAVHIMIADTGLGMSDAKVAALLNRFTPTGDHGLVYETAGFGLAMIGDYAKLMGGEMCIMSKQGQGTEVHLTLPFALMMIDEEEFLPEEEKLPFLPTRVVAPRGNAKARILVVDDLTSSRQVMVLSLQKMGYETIGADGGHQALELLETEKFDLIFMDIQMPEMDGIDVALRIRRDTAGRYPRDIPIVAMTARAMLGDPEKYIAAGMNDYLSKPVIIEDLMNVLEQHIK